MYNTCWIWGSASTTLYNTTRILLTHSFSRGSAAVSHKPWGEEEAERTIAVMSVVDHCVIRQRGRNPGCVEGASQKAGLCLGLLLTRISAWKNWVLILKTNLLLWIPNAVRSNLVCMKMNRKHSLVSLLYKLDSKWLLSKPESLWTCLLWRRATLV